jgi:putative NADH-flavin reductase
MDDPHKLTRRIAVLGASGSVGRLIVARLLERGFQVVCQSRSAEKLAHLKGRADVRIFDPRDAAQLSEFVAGADGVIFALGIDSLGPTTLFSDVTAHLLAAMKKHCVKRLIAITGVGAGETRGHGGFVYDRIIFPLFTRHRYADKEKQEALIAGSGLDWTIVRPAPFSEEKSGGALEIHTDIPTDLRLTGISHDEVASFVVDQLDSVEYLHRRPFLGHR